VIILAGLINFAITRAIRTNDARPVRIPKVRDTLITTRSVSTSPARSRSNTTSTTDQRGGRA
jgi:cellobiose transport system permease protein